LTSIAYTDEATAKVPLRRAACEAFQPRREAGILTATVDPESFHRLLRERCMTGEQLRRRTGLSSATLAKLNRGERVSDDVFRRVVFELQGHPVVPIAQQLAGEQPLRAGEGQEGAA
jgi:hypothetical protein